MFPALMLCENSWCKGHRSLAYPYIPALCAIYEPGLKSIFVAKLVVVLNFCILINNKLNPVQKFKTPGF
ncbi:MAG: hypothetical protein JG782_1168 [Anaerophaga sp.]|nr:hypothetical protein [Anaerophaga sp.]MDI3520737.1 hypothetical protein [Anaerophaga sp.]MDK2842081.1 hypothetical protein [Anaerophaga sp.]MDN5291513.1 hypothetical protein [Anaerophaga sp.]